MSDCVRRFDVSCKERPGGVDKPLKRRSIHTKAAIYWAINIDNPLLNDDMDLKLADF